MNQDMATSFLRNLFLPVPHSRIFLTQAQYGTNSLTDATIPQLHGDVRIGPWFFGQCPRDKNGAVVGVSHVWTDLDHVAVPPDNVFIAPPSAMVMSGHGLHLYHVLSELVQVDYGIRLTKLSALAYGGDTSVCEPQRILRLPGSINNKIQTDPKECYIANESWKVYTPFDLEERLVASIVTQHWVDGQRHQLSLSLAALLARADWDVDRALRTVDHVCEFTGDTEVGDRHYAVQSTFNRRFNGELVSSAFLRDLMNKDFRRLLECLGIRARDGELLYNDEVFGKLATVTKNLVTLVIEQVKDWAWAEGVPVKWKGDHWHHYDDDVLRKEIFEVFAKIKVIQANEETEFNPRVADATAVMQVFKGHCKVNELGDPRDDIIPLKNCVLEIPSFKSRAHSPEDLNRFVLPVEYDPGAECPMWVNFLLHATGGDGEVINFLQEFIGYCLKLGNPYEKMLWIQGRSGTGKSTFLGTVYSLFGQAAVPIKPNDLNDQVIAAVCHAHIAVCLEISRRQLQTRRINELVSGDVVQGRFLYGRQFDVKYRGKMLWSSNSFPPVDEGEGLWRRLVTVPFNKVPHAEDIVLKTKLLKELPGILNWAILGLKRIMDDYSRTGYWPIPKVAVDLLLGYKEAAEIMAQFADDVMEFHPSYLIPVDELYIAYKTWADNHGHRPMPCDSIWFNEMKKLGLNRTLHPMKTRSGPKRAFQGGKLRPIEFDGLKVGGETYER